MKKFSKIFFYLTAVVLLSWLLPWLLQFAASKPGNDPFTLYSCVTKRFAYIQSSKDNGVKRYDANGTEYTVAQFDSILPTFYYRQLFSKDRLPDTINGKEVTPKIIAHGNFTFKQSARDVNVTKPALNMIMESMPDRIDLENPIEAFRTTDRITFIDMRDNTVNEKKSALFDKVMKQKGFEFPVRTLSGNPTNRKEYDEGYMLLDGKGGLYHFKQLRGRPYVRRVDLPDSVRIADIFITEFSNRRSYAFLSDEAHNFYVLTNPGYELKQLPVGHFDPRSENIMIVADLFNWTVSISGEEGTRYYAVDADDYSLCDTLTYPAAEGVRQRVAEWLFPFDLSFTSYDDQYVYPRLGRFSACALLLNVLLAVVYLIVRRRHLRRAWLPAAGIVLLGLFLFVPLMVIRR